MEGGEINCNNTPAILIKNSHEASFNLVRLNIVLTDNRPNRGSPIQKSIQDECVIEDIDFELPRHTSLLNTEDLAKSFTILFTPPIQK